MRAAKPVELSTLSRDSISTLTPEQDIEMRRMDPNGDGFIAPKQARAEARLAAELRSSLSFWKKVALAILAFLFLSWIGNACLMAAIVFLSKDLKVEGGSIKNMGGFAVTTHNQRNVYEVTLITLGGGGTPGNSSMGNSPSPVVAQVACANVLLAIASIENGDDESLVKIAVGNAGDIWEPRMSAASFHLREKSFGIDQIYVGDQRHVSYDVTCEISQADCESTPDSLCDARTFLDDLSFEGAFDGDQKASRRRLTTAKLTTAEILGEVYQDSTSGDSLNTVDDLCALVPNSTKGVELLCKDMSGVGLDEKIYCGQEVLKDTEEVPLKSAPLEPSFTMREVLVTADTEQTYNAVVDRCQPTTARRQMGLNPYENYGWCSTALGFVAARASSGVIGQQKDSAHYCDPSSSEASQGQGSQLSSCCVEHDKCLTCDPGSRGCTGSSKSGEQCDLELSTCAWQVSCRTQNTYSVWSWSWRGGWRRVTKTILGYDVACATVSTLIAGVMGNPVALPNGGQMC